MTLVYCSFQFVLLVPVRSSSYVPVPVTVLNHSQRTYFKQGLSLYHGKRRNVVNGFEHFQCLVAFSVLEDSHKMARAFVMYKDAIGSC